MNHGDHHYSSTDSEHDTHTPCCKMHYTSKITIDTRNIHHISQLQVHQWDNFKQNRNNNNNNNNNATRRHHPFISYIQTSHVIFVITPQYHDQYTSNITRTLNNDWETNLLQHIQVLQEDKLIRLQVLQIDTTITISPDKGSDKAIGSFEFIIKVPIKSLLHAVGLHLVKTQTLSKQRV